MNYPTVQPQFNPKGAVTKAKFGSTRIKKMAERQGEDLNLTDYENWLLSRYDSRLGIPCGMERLTHPGWVDHVRSDLPSSDSTWDQYEFHVRSGFGDEWFFDQDRAPEPDSEEDRPPGKKNVDVENA